MLPKVNYFELSPQDLNNKIPFVVKSLVERMTEMEHLGVDGLFRINGSSVSMENLINDLNTSFVIDWTKYPNIHTISGTLKRYFRDLSTEKPIIPFDLYNSLIDIASNSERFDSLKEVMSKIPKGNLMTLKYFCSFLKEISKNSLVNKMTTGNLAICISPNIVVYHDQTNPMLISTTSLASKAFELMIERCDTIFDFEVSEKDFATEFDLVLGSMCGFDVTFLPDMVKRCSERKGRLTPLMAFCEYSELPEHRRPRREPPQPPDSDALNFVGRRPSSEQQAFHKRKQHSVYSNELYSMMMSNGPDQLMTFTEFVSNALSGNDEDDSTDETHNRDD